MKINRVRENILLWLFFLKRYSTDPSPIPSPQHDPVPELGCRPQTAPSGDIDDVEYSEYTKQEDGALSTTIKEEVSDPDNVDERDMSASDHL